jgi:hypothetical protein
MAKMERPGKRHSVMHEGMENKSPRFEDASMDKKGGSVDDGAERSGTAPTPKSLGGRTA